MLRRHVFAGNLTGQSGGDRLDALIVRRLGVLARSVQMELVAIRSKEDGIGRQRIFLLGFLLHRLRIDAQESQRRPAGGFRKASLDAANFHLDHLGRKVELLGVRRHFGQFVAGQLGLVSQLPLFAGDFHLVVRCGFTRQTGHGPAVALGKHGIASLLVLAGIAGQGLRRGLADRLQVGFNFLLRLAEDKFVHVLEARLAGKGLAHCLGHLFDLAQELTQDVRILAGHLLGDHAPGFGVLAGAAHQVGVELFQQSLAPAELRQVLVRADQVIEDLAG